MPGGKKTGGWSQGQGRNNAELKQKSQSSTDHHHQGTRLELAQEQAPGAPKTETPKHQLQDSQASRAENLQTIMAKTQAKVGL